MDRWDRILSEQHVLVELQSTKKFDAIREVSAVLKDDEAIEDPKLFLANLIRREKENSTGIGKGVAVPHAHEDSIRRQILAVGISKQGIDFDAIDGELVHIVAVLATPKKHQKQHMELLAALSRVLQDQQVRSTLIGASRAFEVVSALTESGN